MNSRLPIHELRSHLESARLRTIEKVATRGGAPSADDLREIATLQAALTAVREEIEAHEVRLGGGAERPLR